jgi:hypothetical protein
VPTRGKGSGTSRAGFVVALVLVLGACSSSGNSASPGAPTTTFHGTPALTLPGLVAPARSHKIVFTGEQREVETAFRTLLADYERKDVDAAYAIQENPKVTKVQVRSFMNSYQVRLFRIDDIFVNGTDATIDYENAIVGRNVKPNATTTLLGQREFWTKVDGRWKMVSDTAFTPGIPSDLRSVTVTLRDGEPIVVPTPLPATDFAFLLKNTGRAPKGVFILRVPPNLPLSTVLSAIRTVGTRRNAAGSIFPDGIVEMGATADVASHRDGTMVFSRRLAKGKYVLVTRSAGSSGQLLPDETAVFTIN